MVEKKATKKATTAKAAEPTKTTVKRAACKKAATVDVSKENVGFKAGDVYQVLAAAESSLSVSEIAKAAGITEAETFLGIGWLLKEGKIVSEDNKIALA